MNVTSSKETSPKTTFWRVFATIFFPLVLIVTGVVAIFYKGQKQEIINHIHTEEFVKAVLEPLSMLWFVLCGGGVLCCYVLARNLMNRMEGKQELAKHRDLLEELVKARTAELEIANRLLQSSEERAHLVKEIASAANADDNTEEVLLVAIRSIAKHMQWPIGHVQVIAPDDGCKMIPTAMWYVEDPAAYQEFIARTGEISFSLGNGLPGMVLLEKKAILLEDISVCINFLRSSVAARSGINAGFALPVFVHGEVVAILEFFAHQMNKLGEDVISFAEQIGEQLTFLMERKQGEETLRLEQEKAQQYLNVAGSVIVVIGEDERINLVNKAGLQLLGYSEEELIGKSWFDKIVFQQDYKLMRTGFRQMIKGKIKPLEVYENIIRLRDGTKKLMSWHNVLIYDKNSKPIGILASGEDITEHRQADKELHKLSQAVEQSPVSVVITDRQGRIQYVNTKFCERTHYRSEEVLGKNPRILKSGSLPQPFYQDLWHTILAGQIWRGDFLNKTKEGEQYWERASISSIMDAKGSITHFIAIKEDITEQKEMEEELLQAKVEAELSNKAKGDFLANMSHEIRTPMNAVIGLTHLALQTDLQPKQRDYLQKISVSAQSLMKIINDILDFSKFAAGKLIMENIPFNLWQVLEDVTTILNSTAEEKGLEMVLNVAKNVPMRLRGDPHRLKQILLNLFSNALKFTEKGEIVLTVKLMKHELNTVQLEFNLRDTGIGMNEQEKSRLFSAFTQADGSTTRKYGGTGLGLVISKQLVEMMGGAMHVKSQPLQGSEFIFTVNFNSYGDDDGKDQQSHYISGVVLAHKEWNHLRGARILLVEDNEINLQVAREIMEQKNIIVTAARNGLEAVEMVKKMDFDGVLMDIQMPEMGGLEATALIRKHYPNISLPIIAMTADVVPLRLEAYLAGGMNDSIFKPIDIEQMFKTISKWVKPQSVIPDVGRQGKPQGGMQEMTVDISRLQGINVESALARVGGNKKLYHKLLLQFLLNNTGTIDILQVALGQGDYPLVNMNLHTLKGVAGNIGADHLYVAIQEFERSIKEGQRGKIAEQMELFSSSLLKVLVSIQELEQSGAVVHSPQGGESPADLSQCKTLITSLQGYLANYDTEATGVFDKLKALPVSASYQAEFKKIQISMSNYDFEKALEQLNEIEKLMQ